MLVVLKNSNQPLNFQFENLVVDLVSFSLSLTNYNISQLRILLSKI
jgi:hypothetical protein